MNSIKLREARRQFQLLFSSLCVSCGVPGHVDHCVGRVALLLVAGVTSPRWSSTSISLTSAGGSAGGPGLVAVCCKGVPLLWHSFQHCFERRTLRRWSSPVKFWYSFGGRFLNLNLCLTLQCHTRFAFSGKRKGLRLNKFTIHSPSSAMLFAVWKVFPLFLRQNIEKAARVFL